MSTLNILCVICYEHFKKADKVSSTTMCGHLFHEECLIRWVVTSNTCPQCRHPCHRDMIHRVYLNFDEETTGEGGDPQEERSRINEPNWEQISQPISTEYVPPGAIKVGTDHEGNDAYVARVFFKGDLLPANYVPQKAVVYTPWNCRAHTVSENVAILLNGSYEWVSDRDGRVPINAVATGITSQYETLYTGKGTYQGRTIGGKVHPSHGVLYIPYDGMEVNVKEYEVLVQVPKGPERTLETFTNPEANS